MIKLSGKNPAFSEKKAQGRIELLWSDFESTDAKAGYQYRDADMIEKIISQWIVSYEAQLHEFVAPNPKYAYLLDEAE